MPQLQEVLRCLKRAAGVVYSLFGIIMIGLVIVVTCLPVVIKYLCDTDYSPKRPRRNSRAWR